MNGDPAALDQLDALADLAAQVRCGVLICPPAPLIGAMVARAGAVAVGAQDCHSNASGAHTGDIAAPLLRAVGASHVIVGHSERRADHGETDAIARAKARAAHDAGLTAIVCLGETEAERDGGRVLEVISAQLAGSVPDGATAANTVIAYEPVWAIGTGRTPDSDQIAEVHALLRERLTARLSDGAEVTLLYGGSVKAGNAAQIFAIPHVDGALVGGASLTADDFAPIIAALDRA